MNREYRINENIKEEFIDLVLPEGKIEKNVTIEYALETSNNFDLDLVEMAPSKDEKLSVCKILDFGKLLYINNKKLKQHRPPLLKEIKWGFKISDHDLFIKNKKAKELLQKKHKVRYSVNLVGREKNMVDNALVRIKQNLDFFEDVAKIDEIQVSEGGGKISIFSVLSPI
jgi:translation initiation factor IF-3